MAKNRFYGTAFWKDLRKAALKRDGFVCQNCGIKCYGRNSPRPYVDHILPRNNKADRPTHEDHISNLATLCGPCHNRKTMREQGRMPDLGVTAINGFPEGSSWG